MEGGLIGIMKKPLESSQLPQSSTLRHLVCTGRTVAILTLAVVCLIKVSAMAG